MPRCALLVALGIALAACGADEPDGYGGTPIDFQLAGDPEDIRLYERLARAYERRTGARVRVIGVGDGKDHIAKLTSSFAARRAPDVFLLNYRNMGGFAARGVLAPVGGIDRSAFYAPPFQAFTYEDQLRCVPQNISSLVVYYNRDLLERAGVPRPGAAWTHEQFMDAARRLTRGDVHGAGLEPGAIRAAAFVWSGGGELTDDPVRPTRFTLDDPGARRGLEAMLAVAEVAPSAKEAESKSLEERFIAGELAMFFSSRREVPTFRTIDDFDWDVAPFPTVARPATVLHSDGYCVAKGGDVEAARRFVAFASGEEGQRILARGGRTVPSLKSVAASDAFLDPGRPPASSQVFLDAIPVMRALPTTRNWTAIEESVDLALEQAYYGRSSLDEAVARIEQETAGRF